MTPVVFHLPIPPSINSAKGINRRQARPYTQKHVTEWRKQAAASLRVQGVVGIEGPFLVVINMEKPNKLSDADNRMKLLFDLLHTQKITSDDRYCSGFATAWLPKGSDKIHISLVPTHDLAIQFQQSKEDASLGGWFPNDAIAHTNKEN